MLNFRTHLQDNITTIVRAAVGSGTDPTDYVRTFDSYLHDIDIIDNPFVVINVRTAEKASQSEIGNTYDLYMWTVHIYYIDITDTYASGDNRRNLILSKIEKTLEENRRLGNLEVIDTSGHREYVYDSSISAILFDQSGQEEYYTWVSELYLNVYTAKS